MGTKNKGDKSQIGETSIRNLEDLINLNLRTLSDVIEDKIDNRKAALIFTGSRTVTSSLKVGIEAAKLGLTTISGVNVGAIKALSDK